MYKTLEPIKRDGKIKEQVEIEHDIRRKYPQKWGEVLKDKRITYYHNDSLNAEISKIPSKYNCPYENTGHGDGYFVSKDMYESLIAVCRCGRKKTDSHVLKCLQKAKDLLPNHVDVLDSTKEKNEKFPETSLGVYGWRKHRFVELELSTKYVSPRYDMPGGKIDHRPYSNLFFG